MKHSNIELLAPAGDRLSFIGAINAGANAVYISGKSFGARKFANNFTNDEIKEMVTYAHLRNVKVFVTINTLIFENEIDDLFSYADDLVISKVDALIVQDLGIIEQFILRYPNTEIHASTQMNVYQTEQLKYLKNLGVSRVILARETSVDQIKKMTKDVAMDLEVFVHGALCVSYSGNCLFSAFNGGRSGNRGECAQPCRLKYELYKEDKLVEDESYLLSTKDLMTIKELKTVIESGVLSLKIEGRMRKPEYVIATVRAYREAIDHILDNTDFDIQLRITELLKVFNREYTKGYLLNENPFDINNAFRPNHQGVHVGTVVNFNNGKTSIKLADTLHKGDGFRILGDADVGGRVDRILKDGQKVEYAYKGDTIEIDLIKKVAKGLEVRKTLDIDLNDSIKPYFNENYNLIPLNGHIDIYIGQTIKVSLKTTFSSTINIESEYVVPKANKKVQTKESLYTQFSKLGQTHYYLNEFSVNSDELGFIPNSVINELRRDIVQAIEHEVHNSYLGTVSNVKIKPKPMIYVDGNDVVVKVETDAQYKAAVDAGITEIYITERAKIKNEDAYKYMNRVWLRKDDYLSNDKLVIQDVGGLIFTEDKTIISNSTLNVTNSYSLYTLLEKGVKYVTFSEEISVEQINQILKGYIGRYKHYPNTEVVVYGKPDLMLSKYCPITKFEGLNKLNCNLCETFDYRLVDNKNKQYKIKRDGYCNIRILHHKPTNHYSEMTKIKSLGINRYRLNFSDESYAQTTNIIKQFQMRIN